MLSEPKFITREPQPYAAIRLSVEQPEIPQKAPPLIGEILGWAAQHARQAGPAFFNYTAMEPGRPMEMEVGVPVAESIEGDGRVVGGTLPGGRYVTVTWTGPYDRLRDAHEALHQWLAKQNLDSEAAADDKRMTLLEIYVTDPEEVKDPNQWVTEIAFKLKD
jgi:effector-binding domain-containing protein